MWIQKKKKIKSENKSEFRNVENRNSYDEKIHIQWSYEKENIKIHSYELNKWDMKLIIVIMWYKYEKEIL